MPKSTTRKADAAALWNVSPTVITKVPARRIPSALQHLDSTVVEAICAHTATIWHWSGHHALDATDFGPVVDVDDLAYTEELGLHCPADIARVRP